MISLQYSEDIILIGKAVLLVAVGVLLGFLAKHIIRRIIDKVILKKLFKDASTYETSSMINKIISDIIQWIIIIAFLNHSLNLLGFDFLNKAMTYVISNSQTIAIFILIIIGGWLVSKIITAWLRDKDIEYKNEIIILTELVVMAAFILTALEYIGVKATALVELYKVILYIIGVVVILLIVNPKFFQKAKTKEKKSSIKLFNF